jgi:hyperosmotically inducible protein
MLGVGTVLAGALALGTGAARADEPAAAGQASADLATVQDGAITTKIRNQLLASTDLRHLNIAVGTNDGVVTLTGTVSSDAQRRMAVDMARHTGGVTRVDDRLRVVGSTPADPEVPPR